MRTTTHIASAIVCGSIVGILEMALLGRPMSVPPQVATMVAIGTVGAAAALLGVAQAMLARSWHVVTTLTGLKSWWHQANDRSESSRRQPVLDLHAGAFGVLVGGGVLLFVVSQVIPRLLHLDDEDFAPRLGVFVVGAATLGALLVAIVAARAIQPLLRRIDDRFRLPRPADPPLRYLAYVVAPTALGLVPFLWTHRDELGVFAAPFWIVAFMVAQGAVLVGLASWLSKHPRAAPRGAWVIIVMTIGASLGANWTMARRPDVVDWVHETITLRASTQALRALTDFDRDGESSLFGGRDCAPFDSAIHPLAWDVPGNGIDENCDGMDALVDDDQQPIFSNALAPEQVRRYNVVWIVVDAIRADHTSLHGYEHATTPYLEALARDALVFDRAFSQSSATMLSMPSMFIGLNPGSITWEKRKRLEAANDHLTLAQRLGEEGYRTGFVFSKYVPQYIESVQRGFDFLRLASRADKRSSWYSGRSGVAVNHAIEFLMQDRESSNGDEPFFLTIYMPDPHHPYAEHGFGIEGFVDGARGRYNQEIALSDRYIGFLAGFLIYRGLWDDTIFIVTSDHGEEFGEHGGEKHARTCYRESTHVPLLVHVPGIAPRRIEHPVALTDVVPTVLELLGMHDGDLELDGQSLLIPALEPERVSPERPIFCSVISQRAKQGHFFRRSVRTERWLLMNELISGKYELYDIKADPDEHDDLYPRMGDAAHVQALRATLTRTLQGNLAQRLMTK